MLGAVIISYNDGYKLVQWVEHYREMCSAIDRYVIVDNGSEAEYLEKVRCSFPQAEILELGRNLGCTGAYNRGIQYLLEEPKIDCIMLIGNDIRILPEHIIKLTNYLANHETVGMAAPVLLKKDSMIVEDGGCEMNRKTLTLNPRYVGKPYDSIPHETVEVAAVTGGMNVAKRSFYETVGLQDEKLFMYSDEVDMGLRAAAKGIKMALVADAVAWHQHINPQQTQIRHPYSAYLMARNKVYLSYKHNEKKDALHLFASYAISDGARMVRAFLQRDREKIRWYRWHLIGAYHGLKTDMVPNKYSSLEG